MNIEFLFCKTPKEINKIISANLITVRKRRRISQKKLSEISGVSLGSLKRFETSGEISLTSLSKLAIALEIEEELIGLFAEVPYQSIEEVLNESTR